MELIVSTLSTPNRTSSAQIEGAIKIFAESNGPGRDLEWTKKSLFWVKFEADDVAEVSFENCENVGAFIKACKSQIGIETRVGNLRLFLKQNKNDKCLPPGLTIDLLLSQIGNVGRYYDNPLYLHVKENPATITVPSLPVEPKDIFPHAVHRDKLYQRDLAALQLARLLVGEFGLSHTPILDQCFGAGKTSFCCNFRSLLPETPPLDLDRSSYISLKQAAYISVLFSDDIPIREPSAYVLLLLKKTLGSSFNHDFSSCDNVQLLADQASSLCKTKKLLIHFDEVGLYDYNSARAIPLQYEVAKAGNAFRSSGNFYVISGCSCFLHTVGIFNREGFKSVCPAKIISLPLLTKESILALVSDKIDDVFVTHWIDLNLEWFLLYTGGVPRMVLLALRYLQDNAKLDASSTILYDDKDMWSFVYTSSNISHLPNLADIIVLVELAWAEVEFSSDETTSDNVSVTSIFARYGAYFTPVTNSIYKVVISMPLCLLRHWTNWSPRSLLAIVESPDRGSRLERAFRRIFHLRFFQKCISWSMLGLACLDSANIPFPETQYDTSFSFPKIVKDQSYGDDQVDLYMSQIHQKKNEFKLEFQNQTFSKRVLPNLFTLMKKGQYYEPLPLSSSADALIRINENSVLHLQFKNLKESISLALVMEEVETCQVDGWQNYIVIVCSSGHDMSEDVAKSLFEKCKCLVLSKKEVQDFFGVSTLEKLSSKQLSVEQTERFNRDTPPSNFLEILHESPVNIVEPETSVASKKPENFKVTAADKKPVVAKGIGKRRIAPSLSCDTRSSKMPKKGQVK